MNVDALRPPEARALLDLALGAIAAVLDGGSLRRPAVGDLPDRLLDPGASFVTLTRDGDLLGCIGTLSPHRPLAEDVAHHAVAAAFADPRMPPITDADYAAMELKVSVVSPLALLPVASHDELAATVEPGLDGLLVEAPGGHATFLPSVWGQLPDAAAFLDALWRKAGWRPGTWPRGVRAARYRTLEITDPGPRPACGPAVTSARGAFGA